jgi:hypothetical protein
MTTDPHPAPEAQDLIYMAAAASSKSIDQGQFEEAFELLVRVERATL